MDLRGFNILSFFSSGREVWVVKLTKLDRYDYDIFSGTIRIKLCGTNDPDLVDIMSEISRSKGRIYLEGKHFLYLNNYNINSANGETFIDLYVKET